MARCAGLFRSAPGLLEVGPSEGVAEGVVGEVEEVALELGEQRHAAELPALGHVHRAYNRGIVLLEQRSEVAAPPLAVDLAGQGLAAAAETWTALPYAGERAFSDGGLPRGTDYMHARFRSPLTGRFLSVDPVLQVKRAMKMPQLWNRYSYAVGNPLKFIDPTGETINLVFDFSDTDLDIRQRILIARGIKARFVNAGVKDVRVHFKGGPFKGNDKGGTNATVHLRFVTGDLSDRGGTAYGSTPGNPPGNKSLISLALAPSGEQESLNFLINVGSHEASHGSQALTGYSWDRMEVGTSLHPVGAERGSVMQTNVPASLLGAGPREFSASDAKLLQEELNEEPPQ